MPLRTIARITAFSPGQSPPPVSIPMRMRPGTYIAAAARPMALAAALLAGCGGGHETTSQRTPDGPLTVYLSVPLHGVEARSGQAVAAGAGKEAARPHRRAGGQQRKLTPPAFPPPPSHGRGSAAGGNNPHRAAHGGGAGPQTTPTRLDSASPTSSSWDPAAVETNAKRAADDPTTIAYIGELDTGGSAVSVPVTNKVGVLQVSPLDGLTTLTRE